MSITRIAKQHALAIVAAVVAFVLASLPRLLFGQDAAPVVAPVAGWQENAWSIYLLIGTPIAAGVSWALLKLAGLINSRHQIELVHGLTNRLAASIGDAVTMVDQTLKLKIKAAKDPASDGGTSITMAEAATFDDAVWAALKAEYGSWDGIVRVFSPLTGGDADALKAKIGTMKEAAVHTNKMRRAAVAPPTSSRSAQSADPSQP